MIAGTPLFAMVPMGPKLSPFAGLPAFRQFLGNMLLFLYIPILGSPTFVEEEMERMFFEESRDFFNLVDVVCAVGLLLG